MVPSFNQSNKHFPWWMVLLEGIFALIFGILLLANPVAAMATLVQLLGFYFVIHGIFQLVSIFNESSMWGWKLCGGILGILAGMIVINHPFWSTLLVPATFVIFLGVDALIIGSATTLTYQSTVLDAKQQQQMIVALEGDVQAVSNTQMTELTQDLQAEVVSINAQARDTGLGAAMAMLGVFSLLAFGVSFRLPGRDMPPNPVVT